LAGLGTISPEERFERALPNEGNGRISCVDRICLARLCLLRQAFNLRKQLGIGISDLSERKELAWEFVKFCTLTESTMEWWIEFSKGDTVSYIPTLEKHANDENATYGGQKLYAFWLEQAEGIDYSKVTMYDTEINNAWGNAITAVKNGEKSKEDAVAEFYDVVAATYPELEIER